MEGTHSLLRHVSASVLLGVCFEPAPVEVAVQLEVEVGSSLRAIVDRSE